MSALAEREDLTLARAFEMVREATRDKRYLELPIGREVGRYLAAKRKRLTDSSYRTYEHSLANLARGFPHCELEDFELPAGADRLETFMDERWGGGSPRAYNVNHSILSDFFKWHQLRGRMRSNPMDLVERARPRDVHRTTFTREEVHAILAANEDRRDRLALRLLLHYGLRKGALRKVQFKHFDHERKMLTIFTKGQKIRNLPIPDPHFWMDLERLIIDIEAQPKDFLMFVRKAIPYGTPDPDGRRPVRVHEYHDRGMASTPAHRWWKARLAQAGIDPEGQRMHKARHTAGQRMLDATQNLKAVQKLLGHASIQTTADVYTDWDDAQLAASLEIVLEEDS